MHMPEATIEGGFHLSWITTIIIIIIIIRRHCWSLQVGTPLTHSQALPSTPTHSNWSLSTVMNRNKCWAGNTLYYYYDVPRVLRTANYKLLPNESPTVCLQELFRTFYCRIGICLPAPLCERAFSTLDTHSSRANFTALHNVRLQGIIRIIAVVWFY